MKSKIFAGIIFVFITAAVSLGVPVTQIYYQVDYFGAGRWQYSYKVSNISLPGPIEEFTIWFDYGLYDNLTVETLDPPAGNWSEIVIQPEPVLSDDGYYDAKALYPGIGIGQSVSDFAVGFDWLGVGEPGPQLYEILDPVTFKTIDSGTTIPEPATLLLLGLGTLALRMKGRTRRHKENR